MTKLSSLFAILKYLATLRVWDLRETLPSCEWMMDGGIQALFSLNPAHRKQFSIRNNILLKINCLTVFNMSVVDSFDRTRVNSDQFQWNIIVRLIFCRLLWENLNQYSSLMEPPCCHKTFICISSYEKKKKEILLKVYGFE